MIYALIITTVLYVAISLVLTGMLHYSELAVGDPLAYAFEKLGLSRLSGLIAVSAVVAMASVLLVFQVGQPRIWMSMSRDGLLPAIFGRLHKRFRTPAFATIVTGCIVAIPSLFMNITEVTDLTSIGTLFAFVLVSGGVLLMDRKSIRKGAFKVPYVSSRFTLPVIWGISILTYFYLFPQGYSDLQYELSGGWEVIKHHIPSWIFACVAIGLTLLAIWKNLSLIPVLGVLTNMYLMSQLGWTNWMRFGVWLIIGLLLYFTYGYRKSRLNIPVN
jgi:amino acid transporter